MDKISKVLHIKGMSCVGCETKIESDLATLEGIEEVSAKFSDSTVKISYNNELINESQIIERIESLDYKVCKELKNSKRYTKVKKEKTNIIHFIGVIIILILVYLLIENTIGFNSIPEVEQSMSYGMLFVIGLLTSLHCIAMCGGINISQCASYKEQNYKSKFTPSLLYNTGRVISYTLIGGIFGAFGSLINISGEAKGIISILSGALMLIIGINMLDIFPWVRKINPRIPKFLINKFRRGTSKKGPLYIGLLNGFMPCGPLQAMQIYALGTGSFISGSISMLLFSLGTVPLMFGLGALSSFLTSKFSNKMVKVSAVLVIVLAVLMMNRGLSLSGVSILPTTQQVAAGNIAVIDGNVQTITTRLERGSYTPIIVQKGIPVKWTINVKPGELNGCNNPITIPKYNIRVKLVNGDNLIEFTPNENGNIIYTCWMGMISNNITVVEDLSNINQNDLKNNNFLDDKPSSNFGGCCSI